MTPNTEYIDKLANDDQAFRDKLIGLIRDEWPQEIGEYQALVSAQNWEKAGAAVHKIKHKISIFGLEEGYRIARELEYQYKDGIDAPRERFDRVVEVITQYLESL